MITLFTGSPGAGKTASLVDFLSKLPGDRPIFSDGLEGLTLPHTVVNANDWHTELPDGAILVIDEVQRVWRPRAAGSKVPESVAQLETHRHRGIDIFVTTQSPKLMDSNVRALVGRHVHIRDTGILGRWWYEWPETSDAMNWKTCVNKKRIKLSKKAFSLYKSASIHTVPVRGIPRALYLGILALIGFAILAIMGYRAIQAKVNPVPVKPPALQSVPLPGAGGRSHVMAEAYDTTQFFPRVSNRPESAPAYDHLRVVVVMPTIVGGYCIGKLCQCITQQGTNAGLSSAECLTWIGNRPFNPYKSLNPQNSDLPNPSVQVASAEPRPVP